MNAQTQNPQIDAALARARARWLNSATINAGGRWAVLPAAAAAGVGVSMAIAGVRDLLPLAVIGGLGLAGVAVALVWTRQSYARPGLPGAPDYTLALDRALGLNDALPALVENPGAFSGALAARVAGALDPAREKTAAPPRHWAMLVVACLLCLLPLAALTPDALPQAPADPQSSRAKPENPQPSDPPPSGAGSGAASNEPGEGEGQGASNGGKGRDGAGENPQAKPEGSAGEAPKEKPKPDPFTKPPRQPAGAGDNEGQPPPTPEKDPEEKVDSKDTPITPDAGDGETREQRGSRWLYNPKGAPLPGAKPNAPPVTSQGERAIPRQKVTTTERKTLQRLYESLYR